MSSGLFVDYKRGEVDELRRLLRDPNVQKDAKQRRNVMERVIGYMTLGIDMAPLFTEMIMASATKEPLVKKMAYLYISKYASEQQELALLAINTLQKDCRDEDPMVRGLALRAFCSLRVNNLVEYIPQPILVGLVDPSPYVRKTAAVCVLKLYHLAPQEVKNNDFVPKLLDAITDRDPLVVTNALCVLRELFTADGGLQLTKPMIIMLLKRFRDFDEWAQCSIMRLLAQWQPEQEDDVFEILNFLDGKLRHANSAVVMAVSQVFLCLTQSMPKVHSQVFKRVAAPLVTLMAGGDSGVSFCVLKHIKALCAQSSDSFAHDFRTFFPHVNDPDNLALLKMDVLTLLARPDNYMEIVDDLSSWALDHNRTLSKGAVNAISSIGTRVPDAVETVISRLSKFMELDRPVLVTDTLTAARDILRKVPGSGEAVLSQISNIIDMATDGPSQCALLWILGYCGERIESAPYILEKFAANFEACEDSVKLELLSAVFRLFFRRPAETRPALGSILSQATDDAGNVDVHDRALLYMRLLRENIGVARSVALSDSETMDAFAEEEDTELQDSLLSQFDTLAVVYEQPTSSFLKPIKVDGSQDVSFREERNAALGVHEASTSNSGAATNADSGDLLAFDDSTNGAAGDELVLQGQPQLPADVFKQAWKQLPETDKIVLRLVNQPDVQDLVDHMSNHGIKCMASGNQNGVIKCFFYAREMETGAVILTDTMCLLAQGQVQTTVKCESPAHAPQFRRLFSSLISQWAQ